MRLVVLDTETTGLEAKEGHRIIEVGAIEVVARRITENRFHQYVNPERDSDEGALAVHGLTRRFLEDKPKFAEITADLLAFVKDAEVIIHNAAFDLEFLDAELARMGRPPFVQHCNKVTDSLQLAREQHPGKRNSLDALCERYQVSNAHRTLHGALLDAGLLAEVYLAMTRGQDSLAIELDGPSGPVAAARAANTGERPRLAILRASEAEAAEHARILDSIAGESKAKLVWAVDPAG
jgi:DNA polymerase-3 subunit epsilon